MHPLRGVLENRCSEISSQNPLKITMKMFFFSKVTACELLSSRTPLLASSVITVFFWFCFVLFFCLFIFFVFFVFRGIERVIKYLRFNFLLSNRRNNRNHAKNVYPISHTRGQYHIETSQLVFNTGIEPETPLVKFYS